MCVHVWVWISAAIPWNALPRCEHGEFPMGRQRPEEQPGIEHCDLFCFRPLCAVIFPPYLHGDITDGASPERPEGISKCHRATLRSQTPRHKHKYDGGHQIIRANSGVGELRNPLTSLCVNVRFPEQQKAISLGLNKLIPFVVGSTLIITRPPVAFTVPVSILVDSSCSLIGPSGPEHVTLRHAPKVSDGKETQKTWHIQGSQGSMGDRDRAPEGFTRS